MRCLFHFPHKHSESPSSLPVILSLVRAKTQPNFSHESEAMLCCEQRQRESSEEDTAGELNTRHSKQKHKLGVNFTLVANCECHCQILKEGSNLQIKRENMVVWQSSKHPLLSVILQ